MTPHPIALPHFPKLPISTRNTQPLATRTSLQGLMAPEGSQAAMVSGDIVKDGGGEGGIVAGNAVAFSTFQILMNACFYSLYFSPFAFHLDTLQPLYT